MPTTDEDATAWLERQFEDETCDECHGGAANHDAVGVLGNWFARCRKTDIDQQGPIAGTQLVEDETGWSRDSVWYGDQSAAPEMLVSDGYLASYAKGDRRIDLSYFVSPAVNGDGTFEVQLMTMHYRENAEGERIEDVGDVDYSHPFDISWPTYAEALQVARTAAVTDERFKLR